MARPIPIDYAPYYGKYVALVPEDDIVAALRSELNKTLAFLHSVAEGESIVRHPPYTWSVKEVVGHLMDCERVFGYRALRFGAATRPLCPVSTRMRMLALHSSIDFRSKN